jgi:large subunit ribosomal protein L22
MSTLVRAHQTFLRTSPRKLMLVAGLIRHLKVSDALTQLTLSPKRAARPLKKILVQAQKNAVNNSLLKSDSLKIQSVAIGEGPIYKRWRPVSRGRAHPIMKRTSHITITLVGEPVKSPKVKV